MIDEQLRPYMNELIGEHREMHTLTRLLREALARAAEHGWKNSEVREAGTALLALRDHAVRHFAREEDDGCFEDAQAIAPQYGLRVAELRCEHAALLAVLSELTEQAHLDAGRPETWPKLARRVEELLGRLAEHERCEGRLIADVFNVAPDDV